MIGTHDCPFAVGEFFIGRRTARRFVVHQTNVVQSSTMATRQITFEELSQHNKEDDLWLLIDGKGTLLFIFFRRANAVYDVTKFMPEVRCPAHLTR